MVALNSCSSQDAVYDVSHVSLVSRVASLHAHMLVLCCIFNIVVDVALWLCLDQLGYCIIVAVAILNTIVIVIMRCNCYNRCLLNPSEVVVSGVFLCQSICTCVYFFCACRLLNSHQVKVLQIDLQCRDV